MSTTSIKYLPDGKDAFRVLLLTPNGGELVLTGALEDLEPRLDGTPALKANKAVVENAWAFGQHECMYRKVRSAEKRESHQKQAAKHAGLAESIAAMVGDMSGKHRSGWCSACFAPATHTKVAGRWTGPPVYLCGRCGSPTTPCAAPRCPSMANRGSGRTGLPRYCAEHKHQIPSFEGAQRRIDRIDDYEELLRYDKRDLGKATRIAAMAGVGAAVIGPAAFFAAPAVGAAIGSSALGGSLSGAAAVSHGLAMLGGGSLAAGGMGMAGGAAVVAATGAALGGSLGLTTMAAYVGDDKSFRIQQLRDGDGAPVLIASGFLTQGDDDGWGPWRRMIDKRYPDRPVYRVHWGSKELKSLAAVGGAGAGKAAAAKVVAGMAGRGSVKAAAKIPYLGVLLMGKQVAANPWTVAHTRAKMTGVAVATILARTSTPTFVLVGHSLGARAMLSAAQVLAAGSGPVRLEGVHLLGAAASSNGDWHPLNDAVNEAVWNYRSDNDPILKYLYTPAQLGTKALGVVGFSSRLPKIKDVNVSKQVHSHSGYFDLVDLR